MKDGSDDLLSRTKLLSLELLQVCLLLKFTRLIFKCRVSIDANITNGSLSIQKYLGWYMHAVFLYQWLVIHSYHMWFNDLQFYLFVGRSCPALVISFEFFVVLLRNQLSSAVQGCLESVNHAFTANFPFIDLVKASLCYALLRSCVSPTAAVFQVGGIVFLSLWI